MAATSVLSNSYQTKELVYVDSASIGLSSYRRDVPLRGNGVRAHGVCDQVLSALRV